MLTVDRRTFLTGVSALGLNALLPTTPALAIQPSKLVAGPSSARLLGEDQPATAVWSYGNGVPGPELRVRQGEKLRIEAVNRLADETTVHWHGLRPVNAMDGVPYLTQPPIEPGGSFAYDIETKDAGTFWYHPHVNSAEQVGRGLSGALIVEEPEPPAVDRDVVWVLDDWRLGEDNALAQFDGNLHDAAHAGRLGNVATINGLAGRPFTVQSGERVRLRLINAANARIFGLDFAEHAPWQIALDGHPIAPARRPGELVVVPPGGRVDLIVDFTSRPGDSLRVYDRYYQRFAYPLTTIAYGDAAPVRSVALSPPAALPANPVAKPDLAAAEAHEMVFQGGAMGRMSEARYKGKTRSLRELAAMGMVWAVNGEVIPRMTPDDLGQPMLSCKLGRTYRLKWRNDTAFDHPIHLHGHSFHLLARNDQAMRDPIVLDTVLIPAGQSVDIAFVADNPGDWALHCHVLEHAEAGMMGYIRVG